VNHRLIKLHHPLIIPLTPYIPPNPLFSPDGDVELHSDEGHNNESGALAALREHEVRYC
jgi:hypothetical protein